MANFTHKLDEALGITKKMTVYKWVTGKNFRVQTREGYKKPGDQIIPLYTSTNTNTDHFSLAWEDTDESTQAYLAQIEINYDPNKKTQRKYKTREFDFSQVHPVGSPAYQLVGDELLVLDYGTLTDLFLAIPSENFSSVSLYDQDKKLVKTLPM